MMSKLPLSALTKTNPFVKKNKRGMALIMVLSTMVFVIVLIQETMFETQIEHRSAVGELNTLRAYYAAKAGMEINLLRLKSYLKVNSLHAKQIDPIRAYIDLIWRFPFQWPPPVPDGMNTVTASAINNVTKNSLMQSAEFITSIEPETSRIDINDLASPIPSLRQWTFNILTRLILILQLKDKALKEAVSEQDIARILFNIQDWVDPDTVQAVNTTSAESNLYEGDNLPPNRSFISLQELNQVAGMSDILYKAISPFITLYGEKGLNLNTAPAELMLALHEDFTMELAEEIKALTSNPLNPFAFQKDSFTAFLNERDFYALQQELMSENRNSDKEAEDINDEKMVHYLYFDAPHNFLIKSTGFAGDSQKTITASFYTPKAVENRFKTLLEEEEKRVRKKIQREMAEGGKIPVTKEDSEKPKPAEPSPASTPLPKNRSATIIYWKDSI